MRLIKGFKRPSAKELRKTNNMLSAELVAARSEVARLNQLLTEAREDLEKAHNDLHEAFIENSVLRTELDGLHERA